MSQRQEIVEERKEWLVKPRVSIWPEFPCDGALEKPGEFLPRQMEAVPQPHTERD